MVGSSKILTVSYGTFSCTAEGFDDPLAVVKDTTQFFRGVVRDDRFFGAEPPAFDAELASELMRRQIAADEAGGHLTLRPAPAGPAHGALPDEDSIDAAVAEAEARIGAGTAGDPVTAPATTGAPSVSVTMRAADDAAQEIVAPGPVGMAAVAHPAVDASAASALAEHDLAAKLARIRAVVGAQPGAAMALAPAAASVDADTAGDAALHPISEEPSAASPDLVPQSAAGATIAQRDPADADIQDASGQPAAVDAAAGPDGAVASDADLAEVQHDAPTAGADEVAETEAPAASAEATAPEDTIAADAPEFMTASPTEADAALAATSGVAPEPFTGLQGSEPATTEAAETWLSESEPATAEAADTSQSENEAETAETADTWLSGNEAETAETADTALSENAPATDEPADTSLSENAPAAVETAETSLSENAPATAEPLDTALSETAPATAEPADVAAFGQRDEHGIAPAYPGDYPAFDMSHHDPEGAEPPVAEVASAPAAADWSDVAEAVAWQDDDADAPGHAADASGPVSQADAFGPDYGANDWSDADGSLDPMPAGDTDRLAVADEDAGAAPEAEEPDALAAAAPEGRSAATDATETAGSETDEDDLIAAVALAATDTASADDAPLDEGWAGDVAQEAGAPAHDDAAAPRDWLDSDPEDLFAGTARAAAQPSAEPAPVRGDTSDAQEADAAGEAEIGSDEATLAALLARARGEVETAPTADKAAAGHPDRDLPAAAGDHDTAGQGDDATDSTAQDPQIASQPSTQEVTHREAEAEAMRKVADQAKPRLRARVVQVRKAVFDTAFGSAAARRRDERDADKPRIGVRSDRLGAASSLSRDEEEDLARELAAVRAELEGDRAERAAPLRLDNPLPDDAPDTPEGAATEARLQQTMEGARKAVRLASPARAMLTEGDVAESDTARLVDRTNSQFEEPEGNRRRSAIAHLRAAVAATRADRLLGRGPAGEDGDARLYREDLASVVRPRRPKPAPLGRTERPVAEPQAPLQLVPEDRVDTLSDTAAAVQPRRVTSRPNAPLDEGDGDGGMPGGFAAYAESVGARDLPDLLEAAAAYMSFVEGRDQFSRPQLMHTLRGVEDEDWSREDRLRSFGRLLRDGKIEKTRGGRFTASDRIGFRPAHRAVG